jgi:hypothetical protein
MTITPATLAEVTAVLAQWDCHTYQGDPQACVKLHISRYPDCLPDKAYWYEPAKTLYVPVNWKRTLNEPTR